jgi:hypothetical protein
VLNSIGHSLDREQASGRGMGKNLSLSYYELPLFEHISRKKMRLRRKV